MTEAYLFGGVHDVRHLDEHRQPKLLGPVLHSHLHSNMSFSFAKENLVVDPSHQGQHIGSQQVKYMSRRVPNESSHKVAIKDIQE